MDPLLSFTSKKMSKLIQHVKLNPNVVLGFLKRVGGGRQRILLTNKVKRATFVKAGKSLDGSIFPVDLTMYTKTKIHRLVCSNRRKKTY